MPQYRVMTYDMDTESFTTQDGVPEIVTGQTGLRRALRQLQDHGYPCNRSRRDSDPSVLVELIEGEK